MAGAPTIRVLLYSHDSQGLGHVRRNLALAHHITAAVTAAGRQVSGLLVSGLPRATVFSLPAGFDWLTLPGISKDDTGYHARSLTDPADDVFVLRSQVLAATLLSFIPDLVVIDRHVYGVRNELRRPLIKLRRIHRNARIVLGLREVLDAPEVAAAEWRRLNSPLRLRLLVDEVWVYGDADVHDPVATGEAPPALTDRIRYTGYLAHGRDDTPDTDFAAAPPFVLTTPGGGSDGFKLLQTAMAMDVPSGHHHLVVTGPQLADEDFAAIEAAAKPNTTVLRSVPGLSAHIAAASAVVAMGGYNTVCETLATDTPGLIVPREHPRREQLIRARSLERVGAMDMLRGRDLTPHSLGSWVASAVTRRVDRSHLALDGLPTTGRYAVDLLNRPRAGTVRNGVSA